MLETTFVEKCLNHVAPWCTNITRSIEFSSHYDTFYCLIFQLLENAADKMSKKFNCPLKSAVLCSAIGNYVVEACDGGIHSVRNEKGVSNDNFEAKGRREVRIVEGNTEHGVLVKFSEWLADYFSKTDGADVPICRVAIQL